MKTSLIITVLNEEKSIEAFLDSVLMQSQLPNELIIVDGGSSDKTNERFMNYKSRFNKKKIEAQFIIKKGNRSVGRNEAIKNASGEIILISDAGCILDNNWVNALYKPFNDSNTDVVAGYYKGKAKTIFQKCLIPYVLVMPDRVDPENFLPATRSMAIRKSVWKDVGGFPEKFSHNEDYVFALMLTRKKIKILFTDKAIVFWIPRSLPKSAFVMFFRFAFGDAEAQVVRKKVIILFLRYVVGVLLIVAVYSSKSLVLFLLLLASLLVYSIWSVVKNYKYVTDLRAIGILPFLQFLSDIAVISGTILGSIRSWHTQKK